MSYPAYPPSSNNMDLKYLILNEIENTNSSGKKKKHKNHTTDHKVANTANQAWVPKEGNYIKSSPLNIQILDIITDDVKKEMEDPFGSDEPPALISIEEIPTNQNFSYSDNLDVSDLSLPTQKRFEENLENKQKEVAGFQSVFASNNRKYMAATEQLADPEIRKAFYDLREKEKGRYQELCHAYDKFKTIFLERIKELNHAIVKQAFELELLNQTIVGNDSYYKSFSIFGGLGYCYGANFRLQELKQALEKRKLTIGIKDEEQLIIEAEKKSFDHPYEAENKAQQVRHNLVKLSRDIDILKEEVTICNETLKKEYQTVVNTELPKQYYIFHRQRLDALKESFSKSKEDIANRLAELAKDIGLESSTPDSPKSLAYQKQEAELIARRDKFEERQTEIERFLAQRESYFKLAGDLDIKEPITLEDLSLEYNKALNLMRRITALKEDVVLSNSWENIGSLKERYVTYFKIAKKLEELDKEKVQFDQILSKRLEMIVMAGRTYRGYIVHIQESMKAIENHIQAIAKSAQERANWQVNPPKTETLSSSFFGWFSSSSTPVETKKTEQLKSTEVEDKKN